MVFMYTYASNVGEVAMILSIGFLALARDAIRYSIIMN